MASIAVAENDTSIEPFALMFTQSTWLPEILSDEAIPAEALLPGRSPFVAKNSDTAVFAADVTGAASYTWFTPDGASYSNIATIELETRSPGSAKVRLVGTAANGDTVEVAHILQVHEAESP